MDNYRTSRGYNCHNRRVKSWNTYMKSFKRKSEQHKKKSEPLQLQKEGSLEKNFPNRGLMTSIKTECLKSGKMGQLRKGRIKRWKSKIHFRNFNKRQEVKNNNSPQMVIIPDSVESDNKFQNTIA